MDTLSLWIVYGWGVMYLKLLGWLKHSLVCRVFNFFRWAFSAE